LSRNDRSALCCGVDSRGEAGRCSANTTTPSPISTSKFGAKQQVLGSRSNLQDIEDPKGEDP
jgi:hypothetical protein